MNTKVYGASDDLIEFKGDIYGEVGAYTSGDEDSGTLLVFSDGTILNVKYGKSGLAVWGIEVLREGHLLNIVTQCADEDADPHSDIANFSSGLQWAYAATEWERVK